MIQRALGTPLKPGERGVLLARAGVGKTACLTHIALSYLLRNQAVLHVCVDEVPDKIKLWYQELLQNIHTTCKVSQPFYLLQQHIESSRFILSFLHHTFNPVKLEQSLDNLREQVGFKPAAIVLDGFDFERTKHDQIERLAEVAQKRDATLWMSCRTHRHIDTTNHHGIPYPCHEYDDLFQAIILLEPQADDIRLTVLKHYQQYNPEYPTVALDPRTFLLR